PDSRPRRSSPAVVTTFSPLFLLFLVLSSLTLRLFLLVLVPFVVLCGFPSVSWPLGSNGCGSMTVTGFPLSDLQARLSPECVFMAYFLHLCFRFWLSDHDGVFGRSCATFHLEISLHQRFSIDCRLETPSCRTIPQSNPASFRQHHLRPYR
ncbi:hypothetical protein LINPERPRIM_LOCUS19015, partial [Linum perenne]